MRATKLVLGAVVALLVSVLSVGQAGASSGVSQQGVEPGLHAGNFVSSDDQQVCFDLEALGYIGEVTTDMVGGKVDPPANFSNAFVTITLSNGGKDLAWETIGDVTMLAVIVKGGPNFHVYDYVGSGLSADSGLHSPLNNGGKVPKISHYNFCFSIDFFGEGGQGCTPGYWRNHADRWLGVAPGDDFDATFGVDAFDPDITLGAAVQLGGGGINALARHATAALLNAHGGVPNDPGGETVQYPYTPAEVIAMVQDAISDDTIDETKDLFDAANNLGCPLSGTSAVPV